MTKEELKEVVKRIMAAGPILPGTVREQYNICGKPGCKCKNKLNPVRHGPYYQLSYNIGTRSSSMFIRKEDLPEVKKRIENYKAFKKAVKDYIELNVMEAKENGFKD